MWAVGLKQKSSLWERVKRVSEKKEWISSSQAASVLYMHKYQSKQKLWRILKGKEQRIAQDWNPAIEHGNKWEETAIREAKRYLPEASWVRPGIVFDPFSSFCCSPDAVGIVKRDSSLFGLEVKCPFSREVPKTLDQVDRAHIIQSFVCCMIMGATHWYLFYYDPRDKEARSLWKIMASEEAWTLLKEQAELMLAMEEEPPRKNRKEFIKTERWVLEALGVCSICMEEGNNEDRHTPEVQEESMTFPRENNSLFLSDRESPCSDNKPDSHNDSSQRLDKLSKERVLVRCKDQGDEEENRSAIEDIQHIYQAGE